MTDPGSQAQLPAPHKQADPLVINEVLRYFGWDPNKRVTEQTANKHVLDYLQARYNEPGVKITDLVGTFMSDHEAHSVGAVQKILLREVQVSTVIKEEVNFFFIEDYLVALYERYNGTPIDANLSETDRRRTLAEFWVNSYADPMNNAMNEQIKETTGQDTKPWKYSAQELVLAGLATQHYMANDPLILEQLTEKVASDPGYLNYIRGIAGPVGMNWAANEEGYKAAAQWYLSTLGGMFGEVDPDRRAFLIEHDHMFAELLDIGFARDTMLGPNARRGLGLSYDDIGALVLSTGGVSPKLFRFSPDLLKSPMPNIQAIQNGETLEATGTEGFRAMITNMIGATIATAGFAHLSAKATHDEALRGNVEAIWNSLAADLQSMMPGEGYSLESLHGFYQFTAPEILQRVDEDYRRLYGTAQLGQRETTTVITHPAVSVAASGQILSGADLQNAQQFDVPSNYNEYNYNQVVNIYLTHVDSAILEGLLNNLPALMQTDERAAIIYNNVLAKFPNLERDADGRISLTNLPQEDIEHLWHAVMPDTLSEDQQRQVRLVGLEIFVNSQPVLHALIQSEFQDLPYANGRFSLGAMSLEDQKRLKLLIARAFMDTDFALNRVSAVRFEANGNVVWTASATSPTFQLGSAANFETMRLQIFGANRVERETTSTIGEMGEVLFNSNDRMEVMFKDPQQIITMFSTGGQQGVQWAIDNFEYARAWDYYKSRTEDPISLEDFTAQMREGFEKGFTPGTVLIGNQNSTDLFERVMGEIYEDFAWLPSPQLGPVTVTYDNMAAMFIGGPSKGIPILQGGNLQGALENFDYQRAYDEYYKPAMGDNALSFEEFKIAMQDGFTLGNGLNVEIKGDPANTNNVFEMTMGLIDPSFRWVPTPAGGEIHTTNRTRYYVPILNVPVTGVIEVELGETVGTQHNRVYLVDQQGNIIEDANQAADSTKHDLYAELLFQLNNNFALTAGIGSGAIYGLRANTELGENLYGSASIVVDASNSQLFMPVGLGFNYKGLQASAGINLLNPDSPISGALFVQLGHDNKNGVSLGFAGGSFGITGLRLSGQEYVYVPGDPLTSALASFGANLGPLFTAGRTVRDIRTQVEDTRAGFATAVPGGKLFSSELGREILHFSSAIEVRREKPINIILSAFPVFGAFDPHGPTATGRLVDYEPYTDNTLMPQMGQLTTQCQNFNLSDAEACSSFSNNYYAVRIAYKILQRVAEREGKTLGEGLVNAFAELQVAAAPIVNQALRNSGMRFYTGELEHYGVAPDSTTPYFEVDLGRFDADFEGMKQWVPEHQGNIVLHTENFASMMVIFSLWAQDDISALIDAVNDGRIRFRTIAGQWMPAEEVRSQLEFFNVSSVFQQRAGASSEVLPDNATFGDMMNWWQQNARVRPSAPAEAPETQEAQATAPAAETTEAPPVTQISELSHSSPPSETIGILKSMLNAFIGYYGDERLDESSNAFDSKTVNAVMRLQEILGIKQTGIYDAATEAELNIYLTANPTAPGLRGALGGSSGVHLLE